MRGGLIVLTTLVSAVPLSAEGERCESALCRLVSAGSLPDLRWPDFSDYQSRVHSFYSPDGYAFAWTRRGHATEQAQSIIQALEHAEAKGLDSKDYDGSRWPPRLTLLETGRTSAPDLARFDLALTVSVMRYISDLNRGKADPGLYSTGFRLEDGEHDLARFVRKRLVTGSSIRVALESVEPRYPGYQRTLQAFELYNRLASYDDGSSLPTPKRTIEPDGAYAAIHELTSLLRRLGDLPADAPEPKVYAEPVVTAVKHFQARHGLEQDGRLGRKTFEQLNVPVSHRVVQLRLALERWRWMPRSGQPSIVVNIPEFKLALLDQEHEPELAMKVIVGEAGRNATPLLSAEMESVVFRPYWEVPQRILLEELMPQIAKYEPYLARHDFEIVGPHGVLPDITLNEVVLEGLRNGTLRVRQVPGPQNALGAVKFSFPNPHNVYMHDTPAKDLFAKPRRDFSHGCIRVEKPADLAKWVLRDKPGWPPQRISEAMNATDTFQISVNKPIPVLTVYFTAVVSKSGELYFFPDVYGEDAKLERRLTTAVRGRHPRE